MVGMQSPQPVYLTDEEGDYIGSGGGGAPSTITGPLGRRSDATSVSVAWSTEDAALLDGIEGQLTTLAAVRAVATYSVADSAYPAYATPTDMIGIRGSATKTVRIIAMRIAPRSTAAAVQALFYVKRSTANTGGTATNPAGIPYDSGSAAATAVVDIYTAAPTLGTLVGIVKPSLLLSTTLTAGYTFHDFYQGVAQPPNFVSFHQGIVLRGIAEGFYINYAGAALTGGFAAGYEIVWTEE